MADAVEPLVLLTALCTLCHDRHSNLSWAAANTTCRARKHVNGWVTRIWELGCRVWQKTVNRPGFSGGYISWKDVAMPRRKRFSPEIRERAVRLVRDSLHTHDSEHAAIISIAAQIGCSKEALRRWLRESEALEDPRV